VLRLVTNRLDLPAELIAEIYRLRWIIEMSFRPFKQFLGCRHLFSCDHNGVEIQSSSAAEARAAAAGRHRLKTCATSGQTDPASAVSNGIAWRAGANVDAGSRGTGSPTLHHRFQMIPEEGA